MRDRLVDLLGPRGRRLNRNQQADVYQRLSGFLLPRGNKKPQRVNASLLREMWRTASSLELLPLGTKTELGDALVKRIKAGDYKESELWCLSRLGARKLFYGPINLVVPPATATRWAEAILNRRTPATRWRRWRAAPKIPRAICRGHAREYQAQAASDAARRRACWRCSKAKRKTTRAGPHFRRRTALGAGAGERRPPPRLWRDRFLLFLSTSAG
jgi:hypothetical protein